MTGLMEVIQSLEECDQIPEYKKKNDWSFLSVCFTEKMKPDFYLKGIAIGWDTELWVATNSIWIRYGGEKSQRW